MRADATLLVIAALVAWSFWARYSQVASTADAVVMAAAATLLFVGSILGHELAHAIEARWRGLQVEGITLYVFGGATHITNEVARPGDEFALTAVGPWTSIVLGCGFGLVAYGADSVGLHLVGEVAGELGWLNVLLGLFNLLPGAPLDGGRILDSIVWRVTGDRWRAARVSSAAGRVLGGILVGLGVAEAVLVVGGFVPGLWLVLIGWFLMSAAAGERRAAAMRAVLRGRRVWEVTAPLPTVPVGAVAEDVVAACLRVARTDVAAVTEVDRIIGVVALSAVQRLEPEERWRARAEELMTPVGSLPSIQGDAPATDLVPVLGTQPIVVLEGAEPRSVITESQLVATLRWLGPLPAEERARRDAAGAAAARPPGLPSPGPEGPEGTGAEPALPAGRRPAQPRPHRLLRLAVLSASVAVVVAALGVVPLPLAAIRPGPALDVPSLLTTSGPVHPVPGKLLMTTVQIDRPSAFGALGTLVDGDQELLWITSVVPAGIDPAQYDASQRQVFEDSVQLAAAVALREAGYPVRIEGGGAIVQGVGSGTPAAGKLQPGDVIAAVGDEPVAGASDLVAQLSTRPAGVPVTLRVVRDGRPIEVEVTPVLSAEVGHPVIGVAIEDAAPFVELPFSVHVRRFDIGGPSAGLMTALSVYAVTTGTDLTGGAVVAGTGTIDAQGRVGAVGGVAEKVVAAADAGAKVFLVPASVAPTARPPPQGRDLRVVAVDTFSGALATLRSLSAAA